MIRFRALIRKECVVLFASPVAYVVLTTVALLTAILFFEHLHDTIIRGGKPTSGTSPFPEIKNVFLHGY